METKLAIPIAAPDLNSAQEQIKKAFRAGAEIIELRIDYLEQLDINAVETLISNAKSLRNSGIPTIVTCRDKKQGGVIDHPLSLRIDVLTAAVKAGADFIDLEFDNYIKLDKDNSLLSALKKKSKTRLILSAHDFEGKFPNLEKLHRQILNAHPNAVPKLVYTAKHINDCFDAFDLLRETKQDSIIFCMGQAGVISRILAKKLGSLVTFASIDEKTATAPGQITAEQLTKTFHFDNIKPDTELFGIIGSPVAHSASPVIHNAWFQQSNLNKLYLPLLVAGGKEEFDLFLQNILGRAYLSFKGFSVTIPHKQNALNFVIETKGFIEKVTGRIGASNTLLINQRNCLSAYNTDCPAALNAITSALKIKKEGLINLNVAVIGAGGVARAIVAGLSNLKANIKIYNRTIEKAEKLASGFDCSYAGLDDLNDLNAKLLVNCTSVGMYPNTNSTPVPKEYLKKEMAVFDTVYNPPKTLLLKQAERAGAKTIDGLSMFVNQAAAQFELFTGRKPDKNSMREAISAFL